MSELKIGELITDVQQRDAIHIAVAPVIATEILFPGQAIGFAEAGNTEKVNRQAVQKIGIVDPYLKLAVAPGQRFWMFLYPNTVTSLRHDWSHPTFDANAAQESEKWLREFAAKLGKNYEDIVGVPMDEPKIDAKIAESQKWLADLSQSMEGVDMWGGHSVEDLLQIGKDALETGNAHAGDDNSQDRLNEVKTEFLKHVAIVLGKFEPSEEEIQNVYFSCAC
jgi:hypothetical protein